jgi:hypothetical protein
MWGMGQFTRRRRVEAATPFRVHELGGAVTEVLGALGQLRGEVRRRWRWRRLWVGLVLGAAAVASVWMFLMTWYWLCLVGVVLGMVGLQVGVSGDHWLEVEVETLTLGLEMLVGLQPRMAFHMPVEVVLDLRSASAHVPQHVTHRQEIFRDQWLWMVVRLRHGATLALSFARDVREASYFGRRRGQGAQHVGREYMVGLYDGWACDDRKLVEVVTLHTASGWMGHLEETLQEGRAVLKAAVTQLLAGQGRAGERMQQVEVVDWPEEGSVGVRAGAAGEAVGDALAISAQARAAQAPRAVQVGARPVDAVPLEMEMGLVEVVAAGVGPADRRGGRADGV